ncbi:MAG TPA: neutral zinc metallopeptidase, partial [Polyangiaceae bacterium]|nr:neutral zinc metallopeptidase [Polyangiaceae bacterium]
SPDLIDRRGAGGGGVGGSGLLFLLFGLLRSRFGILGVVVALVLFFFMGGLNGLVPEADPRQAGSEPVEAVQSNAPDSELVEFVSFVLDDAQSTWQKKFAEKGETYRNAKLVLFNQRTNSSCGYGSAATGPFYCPGDERVYLDLSFFRELSQRFGAPGDFAQAYVIAHEVGHHVQNTLGVSQRVHESSRSQQRGPAGLSVRLELQADCFAGVWANATRHRDLLEKGDVQEGLAAATAIGDDRLQRSETGTVEPESWTHGSSEQRVRWFSRGYEQGTLEACDTFDTSTL